LDDLGVSPILGDLLLMEYITTIYVSHMRLSKDIR
jgi:hypothetical protein